MQTPLRYSVLLVLLLAVAGGLMFWASSRDAAIMDELAHISAGYGYVHNFDYRLNPEHPPLVKVLAALPLLFLQPNFPTDARAWTSDVNGQWEMGAKFLYESGNNGDTLVHVARVLPILLTLALLLLVYVWAKELMGTRWALLSTALLALSPTVLAHGHYVTTDVGAAFGVVLATYFFVKWLRESSTKHFWFVTLTFGIAELLKFSAVLLVPYFIILAILWALIRPRDSGYHILPTTYHLLLKTIGIFAVGFLLVVYPIYFITTFRYPVEKQVSDTQLTLTSFADGPTPAGAFCKPLRCLADLDITMAKNSVMRPFAQYLLGVLMVLQRSSGGNTNYFLGEVSAGGSHWYFPIVYLLKEPLPTLLLIGIAFLLTFIRSLFSLPSFFRTFRHSFERLRITLAHYFPETAMAIFVIFYWTWSIKSPLNIGVRHLIPVFPFMGILAARFWHNSTAHRIAKSIVIGGLFLWLAAETAFAAPYFLSYFNEFGGGIWNGHAYVTDSNYDWGQDLLRLRDWVNEQNRRCTLIETTEPCGIDKIAVDYFGGGNPQYELGNRAVSWSSSKGNPRNLGIQWLAVSVNTLEGAFGKTAPGFERKPEDSYQWLSKTGLPQPDFKAGTSIFIYHLK